MEVRTPTSSQNECTNRHVHKTLLPHRQSRCLTWKLKSVDSLLYVGATCNHISSPSKIVSCRPRCLTIPYDSFDLQKCLSLIRSGFYRVPCKCGTTHIGQTPHYCDPIETRILYHLRQVGDIRIQYRPTFPTYHDRGATLSGRSSRPSFTPT
jgi:hypothetical protein